MHLNGKADASTGFDMATQVLVAQAAMLFGKPPQNVLVIGWASGVSVGSAARHPAPARIDAVELEPAMLEASRFFEHVNSKPLDDPRVKVILDDARHYVETTRTKYDVIISEPSNPWLTGVANLFTREYFAAARRALSPEGRLMTWFPLYAIDREALRSIVSALSAEFPAVYALVLDRNTPDLMLLATQRPLTPEDLPRWESLPPAVQSDLYRVGTRSTAELWSLLRLMPEDLATLVGAGATQNSDDNLFVELRTPWLVYADHFAPDGEGPSAQAWRSIDAAPSSLAALLEPALAQPGAPRAGELALAALNVRHDAVAAQRWIARAPDSGEAIAASAQLARAQNTLDPPGFGAALDRALAAEPDSFGARVLRAKHRVAQGDDAGALADIDAALALRPGDPALLGVRGRRAATSWAATPRRAPISPRSRRPSTGAGPSSSGCLAGLAALQDGDVDDGTARLERYVEFEPGPGTGLEGTRAGLHGEGSRGRRRARAPEPGDESIPARARLREGRRRAARGGATAAGPRARARPRAGEGSAGAARRLARFTQRGAPAHTAPVNDTSEKLGLWQKLLYSAPTFAGAAIAIPILIHMPKFYSDVVLVPIGYIALAIAVARALDAMVDPAIGWLSDRTTHAARPAPAVHPARRAALRDRALPDVLALAVARACAGAAPGSG